MSGSMALRVIHAAHRAPLSSSASIRLTEPESTLCTLLDDFTGELRKESQIVECRIAGGWVRDKLLGLESNDIDIALSSMMGFPFTLKFAAYLQGRGIEVTRVTKVESRADQSKHLETAKVTVALGLALDLDFVNLRSEEYAESSRIPTEVRFGTPLEDSLRRDITINALFFNVHSRAVEDHTKKALDDLRQGIIRTPLPPRETFLDDPLRVIRCVRFASRFGYDLVPELTDAARDREIQAALDAKITRERIGEEVGKMMKGPDPLRAIQLIDSLHLHHSIFSPPSSTLPSIPVPDNIPHHTAIAAATILHHFISPASTSPSSSPDASQTVTEPQHLTQLFRIPTPHPTLLAHTLSDSPTRRRLFLASALTPYRGLTFQERKKKKLLVEACVREALRLGAQNHYVDGIPVLFAASELLAQPRVEKFESPSPRVALGLLLRDKCVHNPNTGTHWTSSLLFALVQELVSLWDPAQDRLEVDHATDIIHTYTAFVQRVEELDLPRCLEDTPLLNGREVSAVASTKPGPWVSRILDQVMKWQLGHPRGTKEECSTWLKGEFDAGRIRIEDDRAVCREDAADVPRAKKTKLSKGA